MPEQTIENGVFLFYGMKIANNTVILIVASIFVAIMFWLRYFLRKFLLVDW